jgi:hypothetical protein
MTPEGGALVNKPQSQPGNVSFRPSGQLQFINNERNIDSHHDALDFVLRQPFFGPIVEFGRPRALMRRHRLRVLKRAAVGEIRRDPGRPE